MLRSFDRAARPACLLAAVLAATVAGGLAAAFAGDEASRQPVILVTGFEPFGGKAENSSWEGARSLDGKDVAGMKVVAVRLPVVWQKAGDELAAAVARHRPSAVVCFGQGRPEGVSVEKVALNLRRPRLPDNEGRMRPSEKVVEGGPDRYESPEPVDEVVKAVRAVKADAGTSTDAGGYLCNEVFYRLEHIRHAGEHRPAACFFVHVPAIGDVTASGRTCDARAASEVALAVVQVAARLAAGKAEAVPQPAEKR
jgi:pyroglutamyl-peptidase